MGALAIGVVALVLVVALGKKSSAAGGGQVTAFDRKLADAVNWTYSGMPIPGQLDTMIEALERCDGRDYGIALDDIAAAVEARMPDERDPGPVDPNLMASITGMSLQEQIATVGEFWAAGYYDSANLVIDLVQDRLGREYQPCREAA